MNNIIIQYSSKEFNMKNKLANMTKNLVWLMVPLLLTACASSTSSGQLGLDRKQLLLVSAESLEKQSSALYAQTVSKAKQTGTLLPATHSSAKRVTTIANRLIAQTPVFRADAKNWAWDVSVLKSDTVNAYCMPGGKIVVYTGIIDKLKLTDDELAAVIGHEMAHALREHSREQVSQKTLQQQGIALAGMFGGLSPAAINQTQQLGELAISLPFSRHMETESDLMGMELMARAGYNPKAASNVWRKMTQLNGSSDASFLSTHPSNANRISDLEANLPKVLPLYEAAIKK
jgi:Zn-dependent protease with chaperone function